MATQPQKLIIVSGVVGNLQGSSDGQSFSIGAQAVRLPVKANIAPGDRVSAVGVEADPVQLIALRNETTRVNYAIKEPPVDINHLLILLGILLTIVGIGLIILFFVWRKYKADTRKRDFHREAVKLLTSTPVPKTS